MACATSQPVPTTPRSAAASVYTEGVKVLAPQKDVDKNSGHLRGNLLAPIFGDEFPEVQRAPFVVPAHLKFGDDGLGLVRMSQADKKTLLQDGAEETALELIRGCSSLGSDVKCRYWQKKWENSPLVRAEVAFAEHVGRRFAVAVNSGGTAMQLAMKALLHVHRLPKYGMDWEKLREDTVIFSNCFTFRAVPAAVAVIGFGSQLELVETVHDLTLSVDELEQKLTSSEFASKGTKVLLLSYMRGRMPGELPRLVELCKKHDVFIVEDCAHSYGCLFEFPDGEWRATGSLGHVATVSSQANKLINAGEGGMILTEDPRVHLYCIFAAGSYEELYKLHGPMLPPTEGQYGVSAEEREQLKLEAPMHSVRMTAYQGCDYCAQIPLLEARVLCHNYNYFMLRKLLIEDGVGPDCLEFVAQLPAGGSRMAHDSLQMRVRDGSGAPDGQVVKELPGLHAFIEHVKSAGSYPMAKFNSLDNARYYPSWGFLDKNKCKGASYPLTERALTNVVDLRTKFTDDEAAVRKMASVLATAWRATIGGGASQ